MLYSDKKSIMKNHNFPFEREKLKGFPVFKKIPDKQIVQSKPLVIKRFYCCYFLINKSIPILRLQIETENHNGLPASMPVLLQFHLVARVIF